MPSPAISIRPYAEGDEVAIHAAAMESVREVEPWMPWCRPAFSVDDARGWRERQVAAFREGTEFDFVIRNEEGRVLGGCGLNQIDTENRRANLGYWIRSSEAGKGYATAAVKAVVGWAAANTDLQRIEVVVSTENEPSLRVAEKAGARRECLAKDRIRLHGRFHDAAIYVFIRGDNMNA